MNLLFFPTYCSLGISLEHICWYKPRSWREKNVRQDCARIVIYTYKHMHISYAIMSVGVGQNVVSKNRSKYPILARFINIIWAYHTSKLSKSRQKSHLCGRCTTADLFSLVSLLSVLPLVKLASWLDCQILSDFFSLGGGALGRRRFIFICRPCGSPRVPDSISPSALLVEIPTACSPFWLKLVVIICNRASATLVLC